MVGIRTIVLALAAAGLVGAWYFFIRSPQAVRQAELSAALMQAESELAQSELTIQQIPQFLKTKSQLELLRNELNGHLYSRTDLLLLMGDLNRRATVAGLAITELTPTVEEVLALYDRSGEQADFLTIVVRMRGSFFGYGMFVEQLESAPYFRGIVSCAVAESVHDDAVLESSIGFKALIASTEGAQAHE